MKLSQAQLSALSSLTVVIGTVVGRDKLLGTCLASIRDQPGGKDVQILVSGNGTGEQTRQIAKSFEVEFIQQVQRLSAEVHNAAMMKGVRSEYFWIVGDDDVLPRGALLEVADATAPSDRGVRRVDAVIGRSLTFKRDDFSDLGPPTPPSSLWKAGNYSDLAAVARATSGEAALGAFIYRTGLFSLKNLDRYRGTSHNVFGAFWDGLAGVQKLQVEVLDSAIVHLRQAQKEWDHSSIKTSLGLRKYYALLAESVSMQIPSASRPLDRRKALRFAASCDRRERPILEEFVRTYDSREFLALTLSRLPQPVATWCVARLPPENWRRIPTTVSHRVTGVVGKSLAFAVSALRSCGNPAGHVKKRQRM
jgi:hypothetical protein